MSRGEPILWRVKAGVPPLILPLVYGRRLWREPLGGWLAPRWSVRWTGDEFGRRTLAVPVPFIGWVVWAYRRCGCVDCQETRRLTALGQVEERLYGPYCARADEDGVCTRRTLAASGLCREHEEQS